MCCTGPTVRLDSPQHHGRITKASALDTSAFCMPTCIRRPLPIRCSREGKRERKAQRVRSVLPSSQKGAQGGGETHQREGNEAHLRSPTPVRAPPPAEPGLPARLPTRPLEPAPRGPAGAVRRLLLRVPLPLEAQGLGPVPLDQAAVRDAAEGQQAPDRSPAPDPAAARRGGKRKTVSFLLPRTEPHHRFPPLRRRDRIKRLQQLAARIT